MKEWGKMRRRLHFDDDTSNVSKTKSSIRAINGRLVLFTDSSDRAVIKFDKEYPEVLLAQKNISIEENNKVLIYEAGNGYLGLPLAITNPKAQFDLFDSNVANADLALRNLSANVGSCRNVRILTTKNIQELSVHQAFDVVVYEPKSFSNKDLVLRNLSQASSYLKPGGKFYLVTHVKQGAQRYGQLVRDVFDDEASVIARGRGGYRIIEATKIKQPINSVELTSGRTITFQILGFDFEVKTDSSLFSKDDLDMGSRLLLETVDIQKAKKILDVGCGWGPIGIVAATVNPDAKIVMTDVNTRAINITKDNIKHLGLSDRVDIIAADVIDDEVSGGKFDLVLSNPPFHETAINLLTMFKKIKKITTGSGKVVIVVEKTYLKKFEDVLRDSFGNVEIINQNNDYFILRSYKR